MSVPTPTLPMPFLLKLNTDLLIGAIIRNSNPTTEQSRAKAVIAVCAALGQIQAGDAANGLNALEAAVAPANVDPATASAITTAIAFIASKLAALQSLGSGTLLSAMATQIVSTVLAEATAVANKYLPAPAAAGPNLPK